MRQCSIGSIAAVFAVIAIVAGTAVLGGCGGGGGSNAISQLVTSAAGGTVSYNGRASVAIPASALAQDTTITVQPQGSLPAAPSGMAVVSGSGYAFGPSGTAFSSNATLKIAYDPTKLPANVPESSLRICQVVGSGWQDLGGVVDTTAHNVTTPIGHFTTYAILGTVTLHTFQTRDFAGNWSGHWVNTTFGSQNNATMTVAVDDPNKTATITLQIFGNVLGTFNNPPAETYTGTWNDTQFTIDANSTIFGHATLNVDAAGNLTGHADTTQNSRVSSVDLAGTVNSTTMNTTYTVHFRDGSTAAGTLTFNKQ